MLQELQPLISHKSGNLVFQVQLCWDLYGRPKTQWQRVKSYSQPVHLHDQLVYIAARMLMEQPATHNCIICFVEHLQELGNFTEAKEEIHDRYCVSAQPDFALCQCIACKADYDPDCIHSLPAAVAMD